MRWLIPFLAACNGTVGTIALSLTTAPGSTVLDGASSLKIIVTNPHAVTMVERASNGSFDFTLDLPASNSTASIIIDALDSNGDLVATGSSPPIPFGAIDTGVVIYMAKPLSIDIAPVSLSTAHFQVAAGVLSFGTIYAGGRDASSTPLDTVEVYNAFDHSLVAGMPMPEARSEMALGVGANGAVYMFGGNDPSGTPRGNLWRFETTAAPNGAYEDFGDKAGFARSGELALPLGDDRFIVTGSPPAQLAGLDGAVLPLGGIGSLPPAGATVVGSDGIVTAIFADDTTVIRYRNGVFDTIPISSMPGTPATVAALPGGLALVACGGPDAALIDVASGTVQMLPDIPVQPRTGGCAIASTSRYVVIAGGSYFGAPSASADILDANTLAFVATIPLVAPRNNATAIALPNGQVLIAAGDPATATLELFTPDPTE